MTDNNASLSPAFELAGQSEPAVNRSVGTIFKSFWSV